MSSAGRAFVGARPQAPRGTRQASAKTARRKTDDGARHHARPHALGPGLRPRIRDARRRNRRARRARRGSARRSAGLSLRRRARARATSLRPHVRLVGAIGSPIAEFGFNFAVYSEVKKTKNMESALARESAIGNRQ